MDVGPIYRISVFLITLACTCRLISCQVGCNVTWITRPSRNVPGGSLDTESKTALDCRNRCTRESSCQGFDFDRAGKCWLTFSNAADKDNGGYSTHYQLIKTVSACNVNCSAGTSIGWQAHYDSHVNGGSPKDTLQTFEACLKECVGDINCRGFDWDELNPYSRKCWISYYGKNPIQNDSPGVNHFQKIANPCPANGLAIIDPSPGPIQGLSPHSTLPTLVPWVQPAAASNYVYLKAQAIKPAYIVLAGLGGGCILLVIIAVAVLCMYPLKGDGAGTYSRTTKSTKTVHNHRSKNTISTTEENIGMSTITEVPNESRNSYDNRKSNGSAAAATATATTGYVTDDDYNRNSGGSNRHSGGGYEDQYSGIRNSGGSNNRQSTAYNQDDYGTSRASGGEGSQRGFANDGYNTITSTSSHKSAGYTNEGYNTVNSAGSRGSKKSGYEDNAYDSHSQNDRGSTLERSHGRVESIAEEAGEDDYNHSRTSGIDTGTATYNQEDYY